MVGPEKGSSAGSTKKEAPQEIWAREIKAAIDAEILAKVDLAAKFTKPKGIDYKHPRKQPW
jgi:hypothetical protein